VARPEGAGWLGPAAVDPSPSGGNCAVMGPGVHDQAATGQLPGKTVLTPEP